MPDRDLHAGRVVLVVGAIGATVVLAVLLVLWWLSARGIPFGGERRERSYALSVPGPNLQSAPQSDLDTYFAEKRKLLHGLARLDATQGTARIPIEDAMALIAAGTVKVGVRAAAATSPASAPFGVSRWPAEPARAAPRAPEAPR